jgi:hypothetical protein
MLSRPDPQDPGASTAETTDCFDVHVELFISARDIFRYVTDLDGLFVPDFTQELQRQVHHFGSDPFNVTLPDVRFTSQLILQMTQAFSDLLVDVYCYKAPHGSINLLKLSNVPQRFQFFINVCFVRRS